MYFSEQLIDWEYLLAKFALPTDCTFPGALFLERMRFLFMCGMSDRVEALPFEAWRSYITNIIHTANFAMRGGNSSTLHETQAKIAHFEDRLSKLKKVTTILELALWRLRSV